MSDSQQELDGLRRLLSDDPAERQKLLAGLSDALAARGVVESGARAEMLEAVESTDEGDRAGVLETLLATGAILYAPPAIAARVLLGQVGSQPPVVLLVSIYM